jgi:hypothetical protein
MSQLSGSLISVDIQGYHSGAALSHRTDRATLISGSPKTPIHVKSATCY